MEEEIRSAKNRGQLKTDFTTTHQDLLESKYTSNSVGYQGNIAMEKAERETLNEHDTLDAMAKPSNTTIGDKHTIENLTTTNATPSRKPSN